MAAFAAVRGSVGCSIITVARRNETGGLIRERGLGRQLRRDRCLIVGDEMKWLLLKTFRLSVDGRDLNTELVCTFLCHRQCSGRVTSGRSGHHRTRFDHRALSGVTCGLYRGNHEFVEGPDLFFKTTAIDHSAIPPYPVDQAPL